MNKEQRLKKRHNAEKRFRLYGLASILLAIFFVFFLLNAIFSKGSGAFLKTTIDVEINFNADTLELSQQSTKDDLENADYYDLSIDNILNVKSVNGLDEEKSLINLFSPDYEYEIRAFLINNPSFINQTKVLKLTASDDFDQLHKGNYPRHLPEERRRISDFQLNLYDELVNEGKVDKIFNSYLFTKGDSRNPELAGIGGALVGSFLLL
jgi:phosphate transport system permease protein